MRTYKRKTDRGNTPQDVMERAVQEVLVQKRPCRAVAKDFEIPHVTLRRYVLKHKANFKKPEAEDLAVVEVKLDRYGYAKMHAIFKPEHEALLVQYLLKASKLYYGLCPKEVRRLAYEYASQLDLNMPRIWIDNECAGKDWMNIFLKKHKNMSLRTPEATSLGRASSFNRHNVTLFFNNYDAVLEKDEFTPDKIWNLDESGCTTVQRQARIIAETGCKQVGAIVSAERGTLVTICCAVGATGNTIPPMFVFPRVHFRDHFLHGAPPGSIGAAHQSGWMTAETFPMFMRHFVAHVNCTQNNKVLLILDNHDIHISLDVIDYARANGVVLLSFPPHCSHKMQLLDRTVFGPFKTYYNAAADDWMKENKGKTMTIYEIPALVSKAFPRAMTPVNIQSDRPLPNGEGAAAVDGAASDVADADQPIPGPSTSTDAEVVQQTPNHARRSEPVRVGVASKINLNCIRLAFDNIDRQEETLSGAGTSHRVNGIVVQPQSLSCAPERNSTVDKKEKRRTLELSEQPLPIYITSKREGPPPLQFANLSVPLADATERSRQNNFLWVITRLHDTVNQTVSSWTGFNIRTRDNVTVKPDKVGYLPTINAPATELSTVQELLSQSVFIQQHLSLDKIAVIMDQALYAKAAEVAWKHKLRFDSLLLMMGNFHIICYMLSIIGKLFRDAGLWDLAVESGVIAEGSIDKVLDGKQYNRGVRLHKLTYEALMRLVWKGFLEWLENNHSTDLPHLDETFRQSREGLNHADLQSSRVKRDENDVKSIVDMLENNWTNPFSNQPSDLVSLSTGAAATSAITSDLLKARSKGEEAFKIHKERLESGSGFFDPIKKQNLQTFTVLQKNTVVNAGTNREMILKADNRVFGNMLLIAQSRKLDMKDVLQYPLGPKPWALANADGTLKKTGKATLGKHLEKEVANVDVPSGSCATIVDAMAIVQMIPGENMTFDELSDAILKKIFNDGRGSGRIDVVFDLYQDQSIKAAERINRGSKCGIMFNQIKPGHRIKNWKRILASTESKAKLTIFLAENWKEECRRSKLGSIILMVITGEQCFKITKDEVTEMTELRSTHEEADTRMMIHAKHAAVNFRTVVVISEDTDVFVILLSLHSQIGTKVLLRRGKKNAMRLIDISRLGTILGKDVCTALIGVHAYTGCDSVSAFAGQGKVKSIRLITKNMEYREMFCDFGKEWHVTEDMFETIQAFTCSLYCLNTSISDVNKLRYEMFRSRKGDISSGQLPPCKDALKQQTNRANYQAAIWRRSLQNSPEIPSPTNGHGWNVVEGKLGICWLTGAPAPDVVLELMSCKCPRRCNENCPCVVNGFSCTPACKLLDCHNMQEEDEVISSKVTRIETRNGGRHSRNQ
ncbi:hypothetical protein GQR58_001134 [Nymphon striatum]|nr:hypothetical protein GQR58_001134 [Nymphon striatum]